jgi:hypothetical protein
MWENDRDHLTRLMVRARASDLQDVPYFIVVIEAEGFQSESWTVQVEIVEQEMLGVLPVDEEPAPLPQVHDMLEYESCNQVVTITELESNSVMS